MQNQITVFESLHQTYQAMHLPVSRILENTDFTINNLKYLHPSLPFKSIDYRPNYFSFLFVKNARGRYTTDDISFNTEPGTIYFTNPGHFKSFEWFEINEVYLITFTEAFLKKNVHVDVFNDFPFLLSETVYPRTLPENEFSQFEQLYLQLDKEYYTSSRYKHKIIGNLLIVLLLKIKEAFWKEYNPIYEGNRSSQIVKTFKLNLEHHFRDLINGKVKKQLRVSEYAALQNLNESYLNQVIKSKTGKTVSTWISDKMISEAKSLLGYPSLSIKEIAYRLGFLETTHFSNYFKKHTRISPAEYRKSALPI
jgi:AraC-like DNA-binding protein